MAAKTEFKAYAAMGDGIGWCLGTYATELEACRAADAEPGRAYVLKVIKERVYENRKRSPAPARPFRDVLERARASK